MSKVPVLLDALVAVCQGLPGLSGAEVTDGPVVTGSAAPDWVVVGFDGDPGGDFQAATVEADWTDLATGRGEQIRIPVTIVVTRGDTDVKTARDEAFAYSSAITGALRADPTLGVPQVQAAAAETRLNQLMTQDGVEVRLMLTVLCNTLG